MTLSLFPSKEKYANPDAPSLLAHLSIPSKKLLGLSIVFFVTIALTIFPFETNFLKISKLTSFFQRYYSHQILLKDFLNLVYQNHILTKIP